MKILVVDDEIVSRRKLQGIAETLGECETAASGEEALRKASALPLPDLVLLDIMLPDMEGYEVARRLRQEEKTRDIPIIFITAKTDDEDETRGLELGAMDYIRKPFSWAVVEARLKTHLELIMHRRHLEGLVAARTDQLREALIAAEAASQAKTMFLDNLSHELRTPMNGVQGFTYLLSSTELSEQQQGYLKLLDRCSRQLMELINRLLDFSAVEKDGMRVHAVRFQMAPLVNSLAGKVAEHAEKKRIELAVAIREEVPAELVGDIRRLHQILFNLLENAVKFSPEGGKVFLEATRIPGPGPQALIRFSVRDEGEGIPPAKQQQIFEAFTQGDGCHSRRHGGLGLGLTLAARFVKLLDGSLELESTPGNGSVFHVCLPFALPACQE